MARKLNAARILIESFMLAFAFGLISPSASAQQFITFNYPGAVGTVTSAISNRGEIVGYYVVDGSDHGFTLLNGQFTPLNVPGAADTLAFGVNDSGEVVGQYLDSGNHPHGFLFNGLTYSTIDFPGADGVMELSGINDLGEIVGFAGTPSGIQGFSLKAGVFTTIDFPGLNSNFTVPLQLNNFGVVAGSYVDAQEKQHGFVYNAGIFTSIDFPGASFTNVLAINDSGELSGFYCGATICQTTADGFQTFTSFNGQFTTINFPVSPNELNIGLALNNARQLVGSYIDTEGQAHGAVSAVGPFAYITTGLNTPDNLLVIDAPTGLQVAAISIPGVSITPASTPDGKHVYVTCGSGSPGIIAANEVCVVDTATNMVVNTIPVGNGAFGLAITPKGESAYVANFGDNTVSVINIPRGTVTATIPVGTNPRGVAITPNGQLAYISFQGGVSVISPATNKVLTTISPVQGEGFPVFTPNGDFAYITSSGSLSSPGVVTVISTATNSVAATISVGSAPISTVISPDGSTAYVANLGDNTISIIDTATRTVIATVPSGGTTPGDAFLTPDGSQLWVLNQNNIAEISTATNSVIAPLPFLNTTGGAGIFVNAPAISQSITQPLSPTAPNTFNFGPHNFTVQYPAGTSFSGVSMTAVAAQATQASIQQRLAGTPFANATCIVYSGTGGNCVDYQVTCSNTGGSKITCPSESTPTISVKTSYDTTQSITNPGFLTAPIGTNNWTNIFESFFLQRIDPTTKGRTSGFSEFVAVDLGATNSQGAGTLQFLAPLQSTDERIFPVGTSIPVSFKLTSVASPGVPVTDATAGITVVMISDAKGNPTSNLVLEKSAAFVFSGGNYVYSLNTTGYLPGLYNVTVYGNAFVAQQVEFTLPAPTTGASISTTLQSLTLNTTANQYAAVFKLTNTGSGAANGLTMTASTLNGAPSVTFLPVSLGDLNPGSSIEVTLSFPSTAGTPESRAVLTIIETYAGGTAGGGFRVTLP